MKKIIAGILIGICLPVVAGYLFVVLGGMPVATKGPPLPFERFLASKAKHAAMDVEIGRPSPVPADEPNLLAGARIYVSNCAVCHGSVDRKAPYIAKAMFPEAPQLVVAPDWVTGDHDPVGKIYWKVKNGIRLTGMPGFFDGLTETEQWQVSQFLHHADKLPESVQEILRREK
jgi:mono/diheme cytochrome c family protein